MPETASQIAAAAIAVTFAAAALTKAVGGAAWRDALGAYGLTHRARRRAAVLVPAAETAVVALALAGSGRAAAALAIALLALFTAAILRTRRRAGSRLPCGCFGGRDPRDHRMLVARNVVLGLLAGVVLAAGEEVRALDALRMPDAGEVLPALLALAGAVALAWMGRSARVAFRRWGNV
jgi:hypothetical protein